MNRSIVIAGALLLVLFAALPAVAQGNGNGQGNGPGGNGQGNQGNGLGNLGPYGGGPPFNRPPFVRPAEAPGQVIVSTPCSTIYVTGSNWGPGTVVDIDREFGGEGCPGQGTPADVNREITGGPNAQAAANAEAQPGAAAGAQAAPAAQAGAAAQPQAFAEAGDASAPQAFTADENGNIAIPVLVPANEMGDFEVTVNGVDADGAPKRQTFNVDVVQAADFIPADDPGTATTFIAFAALLAALVLAVGFNWPSLVHRLRR